MKFFHNTHEKDKKLAYDAAVEQKRETKKSAARKIPCG